ncbi:hypothetical protein FA15DRAFT_42618 [Coprinopsis marcescibilis]|uniref:Uncharacterized protein n=1 Tax=Coprinopsis marcescibilis TaxID=230819 RepID=A0A5C3L6X4_COPMA|nr:hypothetical protein FA15DRAFT_42618 [Coprinopsis marcescibilis]
MPGPPPLSRKAIADRLAQKNTPTIAHFRVKTSGGANSSIPTAAHMTPTQDKPEVVRSATEQVGSLLKTTAPFAPLWMQQDAAEAERRRSNKRSREEGGFGDALSTPRRAGVISAARRAVPMKTVAGDTGELDRTSKKTYLGPGLSLWRDGERIDNPDVDMGSVGSDSDDSAGSLGPRLGRKSIARKTITAPAVHFAQKAARKQDVRTSLFTDSDEESSDDESDSSSSSAVIDSEEEDDDEPDDDDSVKIKEEEDDLGIGELRPFGPAEMVDLYSPPKITIPLPQIVVKPEGPSPPLLKAIECISLISTELHRTNQLPFLVRNVRRGFLLRCRDSGVSVKAKGKGRSSGFRAKYRLDKRDDSFAAMVEGWRCPLCSLHGVFPSKTVLERHLQWDHVEVRFEWIRGLDSWTLGITVPDPDAPVAITGLGIYDNTLAERPMEGELTEDGEDDAANRSLFPHVTLDSPTSSGASSVRLPFTPEPSQPPVSATPSIRTTPVPTDSEDVKPPHIPAEMGASRMVPARGTLRPPPTRISRSKSSEEASTSSSRYSSDTRVTGSEIFSPARTRDPTDRSWTTKPESRPLGSESRQSVESSTVVSSRLRSTTALTTTSTTLRSSAMGSGRLGSSFSTTATVTSSSVTRGYRTPAPGTSYPIILPPEDDPLGPAARPPYLPAVSDYGGPTVEYSCRPGGPTLFDLLGTLPLDEFGVLDWMVLDKEEEIFESDDVKDEYKVMHALWARWILINRSKFIANYKKGVFMFIDAYWKMIHRAAGWDALRYWLLLLLANRFLTAKEVADSLKYYEAYTGMAQWAPPS